MLIKWLKKGGNVGIHGIVLVFSNSQLSDIDTVTDATNSSRQRRFANFPFTFILSRLMFILELRSKPEWLVNGVSM